MDKLTIARLYRCINTRMLSGDAGHALHYAGRALTESVLHEDDRYPYWDQDCSQALFLLSQAIRAGEFHRATWEPRDAWSDSPRESGGYSHACGYDN